MRWVELDGNQESSNKVGADITHIRYYKESLLLAYSDSTVRIDDISHSEFKKLKRFIFDVSVSRREVIRQISGLGIENPCHVKKNITGVILPQFWKVTPLSCPNCGREQNSYETTVKDLRLNIICPNCNETYIMSLNPCNECERYQLFIRIPMDGYDFKAEIKCTVCGMTE